MDDQFRQGEGEDNNGSEDSYETDASGSQVKHESQNKTPNFSLTM